MSQAKNLINKIDGVDTKPPTNENNEDLDEGMRYKTMIKETMDKGSMQVRHALEACNERMHEIMNESQHESPYPASESDYRMAEQASDMIKDAISKVKGMKETKDKSKFMKYEKSKHNS